MRQLQEYVAVGGHVVTSKRGPMRGMAISCGSASGYAALGEASRQSPVGVQQTRQLRKAEFPEV